jgi:hypothetical protein
MRRCLASLVALALLVAVQTPAPATVIPRVPGTPVGRQVSWLLGASHRVPVSSSETAGHVSAGLLTTMGPNHVSILDAVLAEAAGRTGLTLVSYQASRPPRRSW